MICIDLLRVGVAAGLCLVLGGIVVPTWLMFVSL